MRPTIDTLQTADGSPAGTFAYMPSEQASGPLSTRDARSDVCALGALLFELLMLERLRPSALLPVGTTALRFQNFPERLRILHFSTGV